MLNRLWEQTGSGVFGETRLSIMAALFIAKDSRPLLAFLLASAAVLCPRSLVAADVPPRVLGFQRISAADNKDVIAAGQLLLGELNCTSCHQADASLSQAIQRKSAPVLDSLCSRVKPQYLLEFLADPQRAKPGTTMPNVLAGLNDGERPAIVEALVHFLATTGSVTHANPSARAVARGADLFHTIGCVACHDPREQSPISPPPLPLGEGQGEGASIPLGTPSRKYTLPGLTQFLQNPLAVRPGGRMPSFNLSATEARDAASFLLNDLDIVSGLQYAYYEGSWDKLPKFDKLTPVATGDAENFDLIPARRRDNFALRFEGTINLPTDGEYLFLIGSDDGSRLLIDDKLAVANDGIHPFEQRRKKLKMTAGLHSVVVEYFEQEGEESLQVDFEGPGMQQQPLATLLTTPSKQQGTSTAADEFKIDRAKAARGRDLFASLGCAACHSLKVDNSPVVSTSRSKPLAQLAQRGGCLDPTNTKSPRYGLDVTQQAVLATAIEAAKSPANDPPSATLVSRTLVRFNCLACHERNGSGGVAAQRDAYFHSGMPEMGDEGRIPPSLTGVGAKLKSQWLASIFEQGASDRPYMETRMPKFGAANVGYLVKALEEADPVPLPLPLGEGRGEGDRKRSFPPEIPSADEKRIKAAGRRLVGAQGFACIKCHTFAGQRSSGIQAISLTTMTRRLRPDWFYQYLQNPLVYRPGTRMPTPFPDGKTTLPSVLDGTVDSQIAAIWSYLADGDKATYPVGLVTGKIELIAFDEAVIYRNFLEGAGTRAIGVGYPEKLNLAFDAENMRLAMLWHGGFIDAARHWTGRGAGFEKPLGDKVLHLPEGPPLAVLQNADAAWPAQSAKELGFHFEGYRLGSKQQPTFLYSWRDIKIEDESRPIGDQDVFNMHRNIMLRAARIPPLPLGEGRGEGQLWFRAVRADKIDELSDSTFKIDDRWTLKIKSAGKPVRRLQESSHELRIPIVFSGDTAQIELTYDW
jgi:mono/diheme cytochrome c family protein